MIDFNIDDVNAIFTNNSTFLQNATGSISSPELSVQLGILLAGLITFILLIVLVKFFGKNIINRGKDIFTRF